MWDLYSGSIGAYAGVMQCRDIIYTYIYISVHICIYIYMYVGVIDGVISHIYT